MKCRVFRQRKGWLTLALLATAAARPARATEPSILFDLRVHDTGGKEVLLEHPGDSVVLDLWCLVTGADNNLNNDCIHACIGSFKSSNGGLQGNLVGLPPVPPFNQLTSSIGAQHDLDGDGDLDVGGLD